MIDSSGRDKHAHRYWAFISYSSHDEQWARALHGHLERYRIPRGVRPGPAARVPATQRLRPVFRDDDELPASADLGGRLHEALDRSRYLIVLASPTAAASTWVNAEVQHFVEANREDDVLVVVLDGEPGGAPEREPIPAALARRTEGLWVDARGSAKPPRKAVIRLVAGMLGVGFDALWQRDRRRRRRQFATWAAAAVLVAGGVGGVIWQQQQVAAQAKPEQQIAAFRQFLTANIVRTAQGYDPGFSASDVDIDIVRTDDLNGDSLIDFFVLNQTSGFCGSGGCEMGVYVSEGAGQYRRTLDLFGSSTPRTRSTGSSKYKEIVATQYTIDTEPIYTVYRWDGQQYGLSQFEFCDGVFMEYCDPVVITPVDEATQQELTVAANATYRRKPEATAPRTDLPASTASAGDVIGEVQGRDWYLVNVWKGRSAFVARSDITGP